MKGKGIKPIKKGAARMLELGKKPIQIWVSLSEWAELKAAAMVEHRSVAGYVEISALLAAAECLRMHEERHRKS